MIRHHVKEEKSSFGEILRPVAGIISEHGDIRVGIPMYVDSGADISKEKSFQYSTIMNTCDFLENIDCESYIHVRLEDTVEGSLTGFRF